MKTKAMMHIALSIFIATALFMAFRTPVMASSSSAEAIAVWSHNSEGGYLHDIYFSIYDIVGTWSSPGPIYARLVGEDLQPAIAFDYHFKAIAVWSHYEGGATDFDIYYSQWNGSAWSEPMPVDSLSGLDADPSIALWKKDYKGVVVWIHTNVTGPQTPELWYSKWNGTAWESAKPLRTDWPSDLCVETKQPEICYDNSHNAIVVWTDNATQRIFYSVLTYGATEWTYPSEIERQPDGAAVNYRKGISSDRLFGYAKSVWGPESYGNWDVQYAHWKGTYGFENATSIPSKGGNGTAIAFDNRDAIAVYTVQCGVDWYINYSRQVSGLWQPSRLAVNSSYKDFEPRIAFLSNYDAMMVWTVEEDVTETEIYYSVWHRLTDTWTTPARILNVGLSGVDNVVAIASTSGSPTQPIKVHRVAITDVAPLTIEGAVDGAVDEVWDGGLVRIWVFVENGGEYTETFEVRVFIQHPGDDPILIGAQDVTLPQWERIDLGFDWDTTNFGQECSGGVGYMIWAEAVGWETRWWNGIVTVFWRDVAVTNVSVFDTETLDTGVPGSPAAILDGELTVTNNGDLEENDVWITIWADDNEIERYWTFPIPSHQSLILPFEWDTTCHGGHAYTIWAEADLLPFDKIHANNGFVDGVVTVKWHNIAVLSVTPSKTEVGEGEIVDVIVQVENQGDFTETFDVRAFYDANAIGTQTVTLTSHQIQSLTFNWDTTCKGGFEYQIKAEASLVEKEKIATDNILVDGTVKVLKPSAVADPKAIVIQIPKKGDPRNTGAFSIKITNPTPQIISVSMNFSWIGPAPQDTITYLLTGFLDVPPKSSTIVNLPSFSIGDQANRGSFPCQITWRDRYTGKAFTTDPTLVLTRPPPAIGGVVVPVDNFGLLAPCIGLASATVIAAVATVIYIKRVKHRKEKQ